MLQDSLVRAYYHYLADEDYALLKDYLKTKYKLLKPGEQTRLGDEPPKPLPPENTAANANPETKPRAVPDQESPPTARAKAIRPQAEATDPNVGRIRRTFLEDFILFNNPKRPQWEQTDRILSLLDLKKGERIADIGCGPGFFSFRFARLVGETGKVYALDIKQEHLDFMNEYMQREGISNVTTVRSKEDDLCLKEPVDAAFLCSLYHIIYGVAPEPSRQNFIHSLKQALKPQGRLIIVDNGPVEDPHLPYHGPYLAKELAIAQLKQYGFELLSYHQIIPQRYLLVFRQDN
jgi:ubiquinone/menaquinone biosynthesis C-methylase UbiE